MRVAVVGTGLIGGSVGLALARRGHEIAGFDLDEERTMRAKELGAVTEIASRLEDAVRDADVAIVAVPVGQVVDTAVRALDAGAAIVTDVGSVKGPVVAAIERARPDDARRGSSAVTRWPAPSRKVSTVPMPTSSSAPPGC